MAELHDLAAAQEQVDTATKLVDAVREQNWKNGGVLALDRDQAIWDVAVALRAAYARGYEAGQRDMRERAANACRDIGIDWHNDDQELKRFAAEYLAKWITALPLKGGDHDS